jgi:hypothetical protein
VVWYTFARALETVGKACEKFPGMMIRRLPQKFASVKKAI